MPVWYLGTIGFGYTDWKGGFYPPETKTKSFLSYYSRTFNTVELDTTFYGVPKAERISQWLNSVPEGFLFCAKTPRTITHELALNGAGGLMADFVTTMQSLGERLGVILVQLPPSFTAQYFDRLAQFLEALPPGVKYAVELRHPSWYAEQTSAYLKERKIAWVALEYPGLPMKIYPTADFLYIRWIGQHGSYDRHTHEREDKTAALEGWIAQIEAAGEAAREVYGYFNNDYAGFAAGTCLRFKKMLGLGGEPPAVPRQERLF